MCTYMVCSRATNSQEMVLVGWSCTNVGLRGSNSNKHMINYADEKCLICCFSVF
jgi:hypothetical protein